MKKYSNLNKIPVGVVSNYLNTKTVYFIPVKKAIFTSTEIFFPSIYYLENYLFVEILNELHEHIRQYLGNLIEFSFQASLWDHSKMFCAPCESSFTLFRRGFTILPHQLVLDFQESSSNFKCVRVAYLPYPFYISGVFSRFSLFEEILVQYRPLVSSQASLAVLNCSSILICYSQEELWNDFWSTFLKYSLFSIGVESVYCNRS